MDPHIALKFKVLTIGDSGVGKSSLIIRHNNNTFRDDLKATLGIDFTQKTEYRNGKRYDMAIWDTAGQERFRTVTRAYYRDAHAAILVFDLTNPKSLENIEVWHSELMESLKSNKNTQSPVIILVGNKNDMKSVVSQKDVNAMVEKLNISIYVNTSAKTGMHVDQLFNTLLDMLISKQTRVVTGDKLDIGGTKVQQKSCCK